MNAYEMPELIVAAEAGRKPYHEFLRARDMSAGVYRLPVVGEDGQRPHGEDEVYFVLHGKGRVRVAGEERDVMPGSIVYVARNVAHKFHSITEDLTVLVIFAPAEHSSGSGPVITG